MNSPRYLIFICFYIFVSCKESQVAINTTANTQKTINSKSSSTTNLQEQENYKLVWDNGELQYFEIINCNSNGDTSSPNNVLINDRINSIFSTWNHIDSNANEWEGISKNSTAYNVSKNRENFSKTCFKNPVFSSILVKKIWRLGTPTRKWVCFKTF